MVQEEIRHLSLEDGVRITYRVSRAAEGRRPVLLLLHGLSSNLTRWSEFLEHTTLKASWEILRVDLRGHGESMCRCSLGMEVWCEDLLRILDAERYAEAVLVGHSLGAQLAMHFAHRHPARVRGLVLIDPILGPPSLPVMRFKRILVPLLRLTIRGIRLLNRLGLRRRHIPGRDLRALDEEARAKVLAAGNDEEMLKLYRSSWSDLKYFPSASFLEEFLEMVRPLPPLSSITAPVLAVLSKNETYVASEVTKQAVGQFQQAETVAIDAYHWPLTERPTQTREAIEAWCFALDKPESGEASSI